MKKVFSDSHHQALTTSLKLLFSKRLGWEIRFPSGMAWWPDFWAIQPFEVTAKQYLERETEGELGISLEEFKNTKFDLIIASVPQHVDKFIKLRDLYQPQAKLCFQVGNAWSFDTSFPIKNILASAKIPKLNGFNVCEYHQEFSLETFHYAPSNNTRKVYSFINCLGSVDLYRLDFYLFLRLEELLSEYEFRSYGGQNRDGAIAPESAVAEKIREADWGWHMKSGADGYGFVIHQWMAVGRPVIVNYDEYKNKLAGPLLIPDETCIAVSKNDSMETVMEKIRNITPEKHAWMCQRANEQFNNIVNFDQEEIAIRSFLSRLI